MPKTREVFLVTLGYVREAYRILGIQDPPPVALLVYGLIAKNDHPTVSELAEVTGLTLKTTSRTLRQLRLMGLISMEVDTFDTRLKRITLTRKGHDIERALYSSLCKFIKNAHPLCT